MVDPDGTGYISPASLSKFTNAIAGRLSMRVYDDAYTVDTLRMECEYAVPLYPGDINLSKLNGRLNKMDLDAIRERRRNMKRYRMELLQISQRNINTSMGKISIQVALVTLFYYKLVDLREYLS